MRVALSPAALSGTVTVPPSKSMAHRALICAALAQGQSVLHNVAASQDICATANGLRRLGAEICVENDRYTVHGVRRFSAVNTPVDCGESGSTLRFFVPLFSLTNAPVRFTGAPRLFARPQNIYQELFDARGLSFAQTAQGITLCGALPAGAYTIAGNISSQFISGLLFALPLLEQSSTLHITPPFESRSYVLLTLQAMAEFGVHAQWQDASTLFIPGKQHYASCPYTVEGDYSQAAFFAVLGAARGGLTVRGLRADSLQGDQVILDILARCGATFTVQADRVCFDAPATPLRGTDIDLADCPDLGPVLMVLGLLCTGETVLRNAGRLRITESDRIAAMEQEIRRMGGSIRSEGHTVFVRHSALHAADDLHSHNDHRIAMAMAVAALAAQVPVCIHEAQAVRKSYPNFWEDVAALGAKMEKTDETE